MVWASFGHALWLNGGFWARKGGARYQIALSKLKQLKRLPSGWEVTDLAPGTT